VFLIVTRPDTRPTENKADKFESQAAKEAEPASDASNAAAAPSTTVNVTSDPQAAHVDIKPKVKHVLSKELQLYYEKIVEAVESGQDKLKQVALSSIRQDPGIHQLVPYFIQYIAKKVGYSVCFNVVDWFNRIIR
jgi:transcription initiation factor TFIID subunit 6